MTSKQRCLLHLSLISGIGPGVIAKVIASVQSLEDIYTLSNFDFMKRGCSPAAADKLVVGLADEKLLQEEITLIERHNFQLVTLADDDYPELLRTIHLPPPILFYRGVLPTHTTTLAVVGARKATMYGKQALESIIDPIIEQGWTIVSGGAIGIDTFAHQLAVRMNAATVAVIGSGLLRPYPTRNIKLFDEIVDAGGAVVSPFPLRMESLPQNFPARNRIISGLSKGCLVVQAAKKSGALITAQFCLEQGRDVFAIPGAITDPMSEGCNRLIGQGAALVQSAQDILAHYGLKKKSFVQQEIISPYAQLSPLQQELISYCVKPRSIDEIAQRCEHDLPTIQEALFNLQLEGVLHQNHAGLWTHS